MRVLMFGWEFPPNISGGLGTACYGIAKSLNEHGNKIIFVMPKASGNEDKTYAKIISADQVDVLNTSQEYQDVYQRLNLITINSTILPYISSMEYLSQKLKVENIITDKWSQRYKFVGAYGSSLMEDVANYVQVARQVALDYKDEYDVIHAHDWLTFNAGIVAKYISGKPLVVHVHATDFDRGGDGTSDVFRIELDGMTHADKIVAVSQLTKNILIEKYGQPASKIEVVHNGLVRANIKSKRADKNIDGKIVTFLGRVTQQKGPTYFVDVAKKIIESVPDVHFVMAGNGDMMPIIIRMVAASGLSHRFHFTGFLAGGEVNRMLEMSSVYVMPSVSEPFGISPLEAINSSVPVIISKQSGVSEVLNHALKFDYWDLDDLADKIVAVLKYPVLSDTLVKEGQKEVADLTWDKVANKLECIYKSII
ncbi:MAG: glycosyltransferase family 4 protein [Rikenellaceae bacterium]